MKFVIKISLKGFTHRNGIKYVRCILSDRKCTISHRNRWVAPCYHANVGRWMQLSKYNRRSNIVCNLN